MNTLALEQLFNNKKSSSFILINDTIRFSSFPLLVDFSKRALADNNNLIVLLTETSPKSWREQFPLAKHQQIYIIDCYSDPYGWDIDTNEDPYTFKVSNIKEMEKLILTPIMKKAMNTPNCNIVVDSITPLAIISQHRTYQFVKTLSSLTTGKRFLFFFFFMQYHSCTF